MIRANHLNLTTARNLISNYYLIFNRTRLLLYTLIFDCVFERVFSDNPMNPITIMVDFPMIIRFNNNIHDTVLIWILFDTTFFYWYISITRLLLIGSFFHHRIH